ncbi:MULTISPECIES: ricin-type beta-trefoil lectin domain protein [Streptomyces]|uniref:ricin-type beta-trefoil lectin domain protein n=1 Tax=Streptomyces TaxID=1883 RepID=UPI000ABDBA33|nr:MULTISPECIES: ricin-type beta-trefoil lectin domain protein [Streptomyces]
MTESQRRRRRLGRTATVLLLSSTLSVTTLGAEAWAAPGPGMSRTEDTAQIKLPDLPEDVPLDPDLAAVKELSISEEVPVKPYVPANVTPWQEGSGTADPSTVQPGQSVAVTNGLPIALGVPQGTEPSALAGEWKVDLAAPAASEEAGVSGLIMQITPPATVDPNAQVVLDVDTSSFKDLYGAQAGERFGVVLLPDCVLTSPTSGDCSGGTETMTGKDDTESFERLRSSVKVVPAKAAATRNTGAKNLPNRTIVSGTVPVAKLLADEPAPLATGSSVHTAAFVAETAPDPKTLGVLDTGASSASDFGASPLLSSGSWSAGSSSGAFTYGYQVQVPEVAGGLMPKVNLAYSSQSVDGRTSATNNQASWIGDGWDYNAGSITRTYANCRQDAKKPGSNNPTHGTGDLCYGSENATLSLGGSTTELVWDKNKGPIGSDGKPVGQWFTANGDGSKVERLKEPSNDPRPGMKDADGEYWVVTTKDGTKYYFGRNKLPGWSDNGTLADDPYTNSVLAVPVYGNHEDEPCYKAGDWPNSFCNQAWRWNLDYVENIHGNAMSLWWTRDNNYYARNFNWNQPVEYHRDGYLSRIDYGQRKDTVFSATAPASVAFDVEERCYTVESIACTEANFTSKQPGNYRGWYDTPADLRCASGKPCWNAGPTFWSRKRLDKITTSAQRLSSTTARQAVDEYRLAQKFPTTETGVNTALWLDSVTRTGFGRNGAGDASVKLNAVRFLPNREDMPNRVKDDSSPGFSRQRISRVINEYGGETVVTYKKPTGACATGTGLPGKDDTAGLKTNNRFCYPSFWNPDPSVEDIDWFHKYAVDSVEELPNIPGSYPTLTSYEYKDPRWKLAEAEFTKKSTRTYSQFAGVAQTTTITGADDPSSGSKRSKSVTRFFQGMGAGTLVTDITGVGRNVTEPTDPSVIAKDEEPFAGRIAEELTYANADDADTDWLTRSVTVPEAEELARRNRDDGLSPLRSWRVTEPRTTSYTKSSGTGDDKNPERKVETLTQYDENGLPTQVEFLGDTAKPGDESCTRSTYLDRADKNLIGLTKEVLTSPTRCADATFGDLKTLSGATRTAYDHQGYGAALTAATLGEATQTWSLNGEGTGFQNDGTTDFDEIGRVTSRTDPDLKTSTITYTPDKGQVFTVTERNSAGHEQIQELEPGRSVAVKTTDLNGRVSQAEYDPLGRLVKAWGPGRTPSPTAVPDFRAVYTIPEFLPADPTRLPPYVTTYTRGDEGRIDTSVTIYDALGRERQTQEQAVGRGWLITDTLYNRSSEVWRTRNAYLTHEAMPGELFTPEADTAVPNVTEYTYDGLGRVVQEMPFLKYETPGSEGATSQPFPSRATRYEYGADWSTVINPQGSPSYRIYTDALGRSSRVDTFTDAARTAFTSMRYEYDARGQLAKATSSADPTHPWSWTYDHRGRLDSSTDPDAGTTSTKYDHRDRPETVTTQRGTVWNSYDDLSRPKQQRLTDGSGAVLADFTYDSVPGGKGLPASVTRYTDGLAYTQKINGYDKDYQPTSTTLSLPQSIADTWGLQSSYTYGYQYSDTGRLDSATLPAVGALAAEKLVVRYNKDGLPLSISGKDWYGAETVYSPYGQVMRSTLGAQPYRVWTQNTFDEASGELQEQQVYREQTGDTSLVGGILVSKRSYAYDPAGNVTGIQEHSTGIDERQCFSYDPLGQLTKAWTDKNTTCSTGPTNTDGSINATPGTGKTLGSGYWQEYEYDLLGNRKKLTEKDFTGDTTKDAVTTYAYGKADGSQPHTLTKVSKAYKTPAGAAVKAETERLYELTGETKTITDPMTGDSQSLSWTYDGQVDRITGQGTGGKTPYLGLADKCLDLKSGLAAAGQPLQLYGCNDTAAQKLRFTPGPNQADPNLGSLAVYDTWCLQPAANAVGSAVQIQPCSGTAAQQLKRNAAGQLTHVVSGLCVAVKDAATASGTAIVLATCNGTAAAQQWAPQNDTRHIYGPGGSRLLTIKGKQATLHLGEAEVTVQKGGALINTQRTYSAPGGAVMRFAYGSAASWLVAITMDHQGTPYAEVELNGDQSVRIRKQDPFGNQRAAATTSIGMQTHKGFLGATNDDASGFTPLGARLYDPVVGRFLSADPIVDLTDPQQSNGYAYAHNNPVTHSDPTGLAISLTASEKAAALAGAGLSAAEVAQAQATMGKSLSSVILSIAWETLKDFIGINDAMACFGGDMWSCGSLIIDAIPWGKIGKIPSVLRAIDRTIDAIQAFKAAKKAAEIVLKAAKAAEAAALKAKKAAIERAKKAAQAAKKKAADQAKKISDAAVQKTKKTGNPVQKQAQAKAAPKASSAGGSGKGGGKSGGSGKVSTTKAGGSNGGSSRSNGGSSGGSCSTADNSFVPGTKVLMADGSTKPIEQVKAGDKVLATDPKTGETRVETVTAEIKGQGVKHLVKVTIDTDGPSGSKTAQLTATDGHPFWVPALSRWIDATDLTSGQWLQTGTGTHVQITSIERWTAQSATVHNLTVSDLHTYYVLAAVTPVLVHNCNEPQAARASEINESEPGQANFDIHTTAVLDVDIPGAGVTRLVAGNGDGGLTPAQITALADDEFHVTPDLVPGNLHAEQRVILGAMLLSGRPIQGGASRNICRAICGVLIFASGGAPFGEVRPGNGQTTHRVRSMRWP